MMSHIDIIPPTIRLLRDNLNQLESPRDFARQFKSISKEVAVQAEWTLKNHHYFDGDSISGGEFIIAAAGGLNPFSEYELCSDTACRIKSAREIARTLGLYADIVTIPDPISHLMIDFKKPSEKQLRWLNTQMMVLRELQPLIDAGIIRFWSGSMSLCSGCANNMYRRIDEGVSKLSELLGEHVHVDLREEYLDITTSGILESQLVLVKKLSKEDEKYLRSGGSIIDIGRNSYIDVIKEKVRSTMFDLSFSQNVSGMLMSTSRNELYALKAFDDKAPALNEQAVWEEARSIQLPWVNTLTPTQIIQLKESAEKALPAFRESFVRHIAMPGSTIQSTAEKILELREQAAEVERELAALNTSGEAAFRNIAGALGLTISVYGFASGFAAPAVALGGLISLLGLIHGSDRHDQQKESMLQSQPAYLLVKAKEFSEHAKNA